MSSDMSIPEILKLPGMEDVLAEIEQPEYAGRSHGSRATYALKCEGPLCKFAERMRGRRRNEARAARKGEVYVPRGNRVYDREELLPAIIEWHKLDLYRRRMNGVYETEENAS